jgi:hypothetical protein
MPGVYPDPPQTFPFPPPLGRVETETVTAPLVVEPALAKARWSPAKFVRARMEGKTLAECARISGSTAAEENLAHIGYQRLRSEKVQRLLSDVGTDLERGWRGFVQHAADVCEGLVPTATEMDRAANGLAIGRALGKFVTRIQVDHEHRVAFRGFKSPTDAVRALPTTVLEACEAELARRRALPVAHSQPTLTAQSVASEVGSPLHETVQVVDATKVEA